ncbi:hypothetical protein BZ17_3459 [Yersinia pseudotuberculosis IP 32953]|uniref:DUF6890 family protein n=1 Tax=Yersinia pseudotuberculosis TaxID=633 RepID=UPI0001739808|nr:hypothetical protein [Yersinia pseudotuberculosis]AJJ57072.1 hypothetical protein BZ17_3459 [Yersinia pseudotuberculosis IP 32953]AJJ66075.1 hypothetical protein BZ16_2549 [Yersinia pseudotuberculosis PB1/+]MCF1163264.1 hypothetical protein [Yersinia pseudotuberculosis]
MTLRRYYLPSPRDSEEEEGEPDSVMNLARAAWLAEYFYESHVNGTAAGISYAFNGKRDQ